MSTPLSATSVANTYMVRVETTTRMPSDLDQAGALIARTGRRVGGAVVSSSDHQLVQLIVSVTAGGHEEAAREATDLLARVGLVPLVMESMPVSEWILRDSSPAGRIVDLVSVGEAAEALGLTRPAVLYRIQAGLLAARRVGRNYVVAAEAVRDAPRKRQGHARQRQRQRQPQPLPEGHVTTVVAGKMLGITQGRVNQLIHGGSLPALMVRHRWFIPVEALSNRVPRGSVSVQQAAERLGISQKDVRTRIRIGSLPAVKVGHRYLIPTKSLTRAKALTRPGEAFVPPEGYVTTKEAARRLGTTRKSVGSRITKGLLPAKKVGHRLIVPVEALVILPTEGHVSVYEAADRLGVTKWALYERIRSGILPSVKVGQKIAIPIAALDDQAGDLRHARSGRKRNTTDPGDPP